MRKTLDIVNRGEASASSFFDDRQTTCIFFEKMHVKAARRVVAPYKDEKPERGAEDSSACGLRMTKQESATSEA